MKVAGRLGEQDPPDGMLLRRMASGDEDAFTLPYRRRCVKH